MQAIPDEARCLGCGYALRELTTARCPECGREFDPADPRTMWTHRGLGVLAKFLLKPPRRLLNGTVLLAALALLVATAWPGNVFAIVIFAGPLLLSAGAVWVVRLLLALILSWRYKRDLRPHWRAWLAVPLIGALLAVLAVFQVPLYAAFRIAKPDLDRLVAEAQALSTTQPTSLPGRRLGIWYTAEIRVDAGYIVFVVDGGGGTFGHGFAYVGGAVPALTPDRRVDEGLDSRRFWGDWHQWTDFGP